MNTSITSAKPEEPAKKNKTRYRARKKPPSLFMRLIRIVVLFLIVVIVALAILVGTGRAYLESNAEIKHEMTQRISERFGIPISSDDISMRWRWSGPQITVNQLEFKSPDKNTTVLGFEQAQVILDLKRFIKTRTLGVAAIELQGSEIVIERMPGNKIRINQFTVSELEELLRMSDSGVNTSPQAKSPNLPDGLFNFENIDVVYKDNITEKEVRLENIKVNVDKNDQLLSLILIADAEQFAEKIKISASTPNPELHDDFEWQILFEVDAMLLPEITQQWRSLRPLFANKQKPLIQAQNQQMEFVSGESDVKLWMQYKKETIQAMNGTVALQKVDIERDNQPIDGFANNLDIRFSYENVEEYTHFKVDRIRVSSLKGNWPLDNELDLKLLHIPEAEGASNKLSIERESLSDEEVADLEKEPIQPIQTKEINENSEANSRFVQYKLAEASADYIHFDDLTPILELLVKQMPDQARIPDINWSQLQGEIRDLFITAENTNPEGVAGVSTELEILKANMRFNNFGLPSINRGLSITGLDGELLYESGQGTLKLASNNLNFGSPNVFRNTLQFDKLNTNITFTKQDELISLMSDSISLENPDFQIVSDLDLKLQKNKSPVLKTTASIKPKIVDNLKNYLPALVMKPGLVQWLENGVSGGQIDEATLVFNGALEDYPFRNGKGTFKTELNVMDLNVNYASDWPAVLLQEANIIFNNESLLINASKVKTGDLRSFPVTARFRDLAKNKLELEGITTLDLDNGQAWIDTTPLKDTIGQYMQHVDVSGEAVNTISLEIPLDAPDQLLVNGELEFTDNPMKLSSFRNAFSGLTGKLAYTKESISSDSLNAVYAGQDIQAKIRPEGQVIWIDVTTDAQLGSILGPEYADYISGSSNISAEIRMGTEEDPGVQDIKISSNLLGTGLKLPAPFAKAEDTLMALNIRLDLQDVPGKPENDTILVNGNIGDTLIRSKLLPALNKAESDWRVHSISLVGGENRDLFTTIDPGLARIHVLGQFSHVDMDEWLEFINRDSNTEMDDAFEVGVIDVQLEKLDAIGQIFTDAKVVLIPDQSSWEAEISNAQVEGKISFPRPWYDGSLIQANLKKYQLLLPDNKNETIEFDPREIPNVSITVDDFSISDISMGEAQVRIRRETNGAKLETFNVSHPSFSIEGSGGWYRTSDGETSLVSIDLKSNDLANTLKQLGYAPLATARSAEALIELNWPGSPFIDILQDVSGSVSFKLLNGELQDVDPGAGRFLALLSIAQLPKRLSLDFRDVFNAGLGYDELSADFLIQNGQAYTNNMLMRGPVADLGVIGRVGLATRDFDQAAVVQADLGSSLPIAGALAGGLGVGAAMLLFSEIFKNPLKQATQVFYKIDGGWNEPTIVRTAPNQLDEVPIAPR